MDPSFEVLQARRLRLHRLVPPRPVGTVPSSVAFLRERQIVMSTGQASLPVLAEAIAGRALTGSWMASPEVYLIHRVLRGVRRQDVISAPLILGKETLFVPALGPAVERIAGDPGRRNEAQETLPPLARRLLDAVEAKGQVRMDRWPIPSTRARPARMLLERALLVVGTETHTDRGYHTSILRPWRGGVIARRFGRRARALRFEEACAILLSAAARSAVLAPEAEVRRWFVFGGTGLNGLIARGILRRLAVRGRAWITFAQESAASR